MKIAILPPSILSLSLFLCASFPFSPHCVTSLPRAGRGSARNQNTLCNTKIYTKYINPLKFHPNTFLTFFIYKSKNLEKSYFFFSFYIYIYIPNLLSLYKKYVWRSLYSLWSKGSLLHVSIHKCLNVCSMFINLNLPLGCAPRSLLQAK